MFLKTYVRKMVGGNAVPKAAAPSSILLAGVGASLAIGAAAELGAVFETLVLMAPFGASCFLAFAVPDSPLAQPRNIVFGHLISTAVGLIFLMTLGDGPLSMALAVGVAVVLMQGARAGHPPAGADPLVVLAIHPSWGFLVFPGLAGALVVVGIALIFNNLRPGVTYPKYW